MAGYGVLLTRGAGNKDDVDTCSRTCSLSLLTSTNTDRLAGTVCPGGKWHSLFHLCCVSVSPQLSICPKQCGYHETQRHCSPPCPFTDIKWGARRTVGSIFISFGISAGFLVSLFNALHKLPMTFLGAGEVTLQLCWQQLLWCEWWLWSPIAVTDP